MSKIYAKKKKIQIQKKETRVITNTNSWQLTMLPYCTSTSYTPKTSHAFNQLYIYMYMYCVCSQNIS